MVVKNEGLVNLTPDPQTVCILTWVVELCLLGLSNTCVGGRYSPGALTYKRHLCGCKRNHISISIVLQNILLFINTATNRSTERQNAIIHCIENEDKSSSPFGFRPAHSGRGTHKEGTYPHQSNVCSVNTIHKLKTEVSFK